uniref:Chromosome 16 open reading frame 86 n=1 Tax=Suricata suricatta TaxID=37032 RepID=A0A673UVR0_SURSU
VASAGAERWPGSQERTAAGPVQLVESPGDQCLVSDCEACLEDKCPTGPVSEPELQEERLKQEEESLKLEVESLEERGPPRPMASIVRPSHGLKRKPAEAEMPQGPPLQKEESNSSQTEPSPSAKQHKKAKKRKSLGAPVLPAMASTLGAPAPALPRVFAGKAQRLRPLYQYINYCNPELNQAGEGDREAEADVEPELTLALVPEEAGVEQLQALLPVAGELGSGLTLSCPSTFVSPTHALVPLGEEVGEEPGCLPRLGVSGHLKAEVDKSTQVDIDKMLSVCAAPLVPPLSPQYK